MSRKAENPKAGGTGRKAADTAEIRRKLEALYQRCNRREFVHPDPLEFLYRYPKAEDREIAGFLASALAYGRVARILKSVEEVLSILGPSPFSLLKSTPPDKFRPSLTAFRHRFASGDHVLDLLKGLRETLKAYGSLERCFSAGFSESDDTLWPALNRFARRIVGPFQPGHLVPLPERGSACKRLHLYLRWMIRRDAVDPGGWKAVPPSRLIIPVDAHMLRAGRRLGFTARPQADRRTALEITAGFARWVPDDPVKYDFVLTRMGIRDDIPSIFE